MDSAKEVARSLDVARGKDAVLLESGKEVLDQVTRFVQVTVVALRVLARSFRGTNDGFFSRQ